MLAVLSEQWPFYKYLQLQQPCFAVFVVTDEFCSFWSLEHGETRRFWMFSTFFEVKEDFWKISLLDVWFSGVCNYFALKICDEKRFKCFWS